MDILIAKLQSKIEGIKSSLIKNEDAWKTKCHLKLDGKSFNIHACDIDDLKQMYMFIVNRAYLELEANAFLELKGDVYIGDHILSDWQHDIKKRLHELRNFTKKETIKRLDRQLKSLLSDEVKKEMEIAKIEEEIKNL